MAIVATFDPVTGDINPNAVTISRDPVGIILVNNGAVVVQGGTATVANTTSIQVVGDAGNDTVSFDQSNGPLPPGSLTGGTDNDTLTGGSGNDTVSGDDGDDSLVGGAGIDSLLGGNGNDPAIGGIVADFALLGDGNDLFIWNPGDASDIVEGQAGNDTMQFNGANIAERFEISANGGRILFTRDIGTVVMDVDDTEPVNVRALGAADSITVNNLAGTDLTKVNIDLGGSGGGGDGAADTVTASGSAGLDAITVSGLPGSSVSPVWRRRSPFPMRM